MHLVEISRFFALAALLASWPMVAKGELAVNLAIRNQSPEVELCWPAQIAIPGGEINPDYLLLRSFDLKTWVSLPFTNISANSGEILMRAASPANRSGFYRVVAKLDKALANLGPIDGSEVLGFSGLFRQELQKLGPISTDQFAALYPPHANYLDKIGWDPTQAKYWDRILNSEFRLSNAEMGVFTNTGMVVSERLGGYSFADVFYRIYSSDLPVFISTDAILQAWHRSFVTVLQELEETYLSYTLKSILDAMSQGLTTLRSQPNIANNAPLLAVLDNSFKDADYFLTVGRSLLSGTPVASPLGQGRRVDAALQAINNETYLTSFDLFGSPRTVDFSQFKPRGHYADSAVLQCYFRAMMWCGRIDFRIAGRTFGISEEDTRRQLGTAIILSEALKISGKYQDWADVDSILQMFVGHADSMTLSHVQPLLSAAGIAALTQITNAIVLTNLQNAILLGRNGAQEIRGDVFYSPLSAGQIVLPRSFTLIGQRFVMDSWALSQVVFDSIVWDTNGVAELEDKVQRRIPSALDVAFGVLGNNQIVPDLVSRMNNPNGAKFRDGLPYQHNLAAVRTVLDSQKPEGWSDNIYVNWLAVLRELSTPTTGAVFPEAMRTRPWAMKSLNTQLASWTQLRHDTVLYAKQSYTGTLLCEYPYGFVEPAPAFWRRLQQMAERTEAMLDGIPMTGYANWSSFISNVDLAQLKTNLTGHFSNFAQTVAQLKHIAELELAQQPLSAADIDFLKDVMEKHITYTGNKFYSGWYPRLFYASVKSGDWDVSCDKWDALVTDVHTDAPNPMVGDPGCVLHEAVGNVNLMMIAIDNGPDRMVFAGPVLSHYEFEMPGIQRKTDAEWKSNLTSGSMPPHPEWTRGYLVPGNYTVPANIR